MTIEFWDARYREAAELAGSVWSLEPNAWVKATVESLAPGRAVDLAAGEGRNAMWLASLGWHVTAVDFSSVGLEIGASRAAARGLELDWVVADATTWRSSTPMDLAIIAYLQLPEHELRLAIGAAAAALAPGGMLALINHDRANLERGVGGPRDPAILTTVAELTAIIGTCVDGLGRPLELVECREFERSTAAGVAIDAILVARAAR